MNNKKGEVSIYTENHRYKTSTKHMISKSITWSKDLKYVDLGEFKTYFNTFIPKVIVSENAKSTISTILLGYASLNKSKIKMETLYKIAKVCNERVVGDKLEDEDLDKCIKLAFSERNTFVLKDNSAVRFIKNPIVEFDFEEMKRETNKLKKSSNLELTINIVDSWDLDTMGEPTQEKLANILGVSRRTIIRRFKEQSYQEQVLPSWNELKGLYASGIRSEEESEIKVKKIKLNITKKQVKQKRVYKKRVKNVVVNIKPQVEKLIKTSLKVERFNSIFNMCQTI